MSNIAVMTSVSPTVILAIGLISCLTGTVDANVFRGSNPAASIGRMSSEEIRATMLDELMSAFGSSNRVTENRLKTIEEAVRPTFNSMPKNPHGNLGHAAVRYVLHRLFVHRHGMQVQGLDAGGQAWSDNLSSPTNVLANHVPTYVQTLFEDRLKGRGLGVHEIAILAGTLEHLIHNEAAERLRKVFEVKNLSIEEPLTAYRMLEVIDTFMVILITGTDASTMEPEKLEELETRILEIIPNWKAAQKFSHGVIKEVIIANRGKVDFSPGAFTFNGIMNIIEEVTERYGRWQDGECQDLKKALLKLEEPGTGRVPLKRFYGDALSGENWQFRESVAHLRNLGILDESNPRGKSVILANYVNSPSNCLASSGIYAVCCLNECEELMGHIEKTVGQPEGTTASIIEIVSNLPSSTETTPRHIPDNLQNLLAEVAVHHQGRVPLHGRLFAQWMHHVYPHECPYPHKGGTTTTMGLDEAGTKRSSNVDADDDEMRRYAADTPTLDEDAEEEGVESLVIESSKPLMWTADEELVVTPKQPPQSAFKRLWFVIRNFVIFIALASVGLNARQILDAVCVTMTQGSKPQLPYIGKSHYI